MGTDHVETEERFDLDETDALPDFATLPDVRSVSTVHYGLVATYVDTPDLKLAATGISLSRRTGGEDAGWHLKLPTERARLEVHLPLGRAVKTAPVALRRVVAGIVRGQGLAPIVTIRTDRRVLRLHDERGDVLAEVADDRVSAEPLGAAADLAPSSWREAEVELIAADPSLLVATGQLMTAAGFVRSDSASKPARALRDRLSVDAGLDGPTPGKNDAAAEVIRLRLASQLAGLRRLDPWVRHGAPDAVHDMRVTVRRLRNALASYRPFLQRDTTEPLRDELGWLAALLGGPRDCEVLHQLLSSMLDGEPADLVRGPVRTRIDRDLDERWAAVRAELLAGMASPRYFDLVDRLDAFAQAPPWTARAMKPACLVLPQRLDHDWKRLRTRVRAAQGPDAAGDHAAGLHEVRKAAKRVRYAAEALVPLYGTDAARMAEVHERIQTLLGDHHDGAVAQAALIELADRASAAGDNTFTFGILHGRLEAREAALAAAFEPAWRDSVAARGRHRVGSPQVSADR